MSLNVGRTSRLNSSSPCEGQSLLTGRNTLSPEPVGDSLVKSPKNSSPSRPWFRVIWGVVCSICRYLFPCFSTSSHKKEEHKEIPVQPSQGDITSLPSTQVTIPRGYVLGEDGRLYRKAVHVSFADDLDSEEGQGDPVQRQEENIEVAPGTQGSALLDDSFGEDRILHAKTGSEDSIEGHDSEAKSTNLAPPPLPERDCSSSEEDREDEIGYQPNNFEHLPAAEDGEQEIRYERNNFELPPAAAQGNTSDIVLEKTTRPLPRIPSGVVPFGARPVVRNSKEIGVDRFKK